MQWAAITLPLWSWKARSWRRANLAWRLSCVGREDDVQRELARHNTDGLSISVVHASEVVEMDDHVNAVRAKKDNSMSVGMRLIKEGKADAFMSAGNSGAVMAAALFGVGRIRGIDRPALASIFPASKTPTILVDLGANTDPTPQNLVQFAMMGSIYAERVLGLSKPRVAIVSNGEEAEKGSERVKAAYPLLQASGLNFIGNVEGKDIPKGMADVIVTDGFTGNVILKLTEGLVSFLAKIYQGVADRRHLEQDRAGVDDPRPDFDAARHVISAAGRAASAETGGLSRIRRRATVRCRWGCINCARPIGCQGDPGSHPLSAARC